MTQQLGKTLREEPAGKKGSPSHDLESRSRGGAGSKHDSASEAGVGGDVQTMTHDREEQMTLAKRLALISVEK